MAALGIAVGTGNIWRFSRVVAQNGGGSFLIPWIIFLLIWSLPLIIVEFAIGKKERLGPIGALGNIAGKKFAWMGAFIVLVTTAIMFYYSVVAGWCLRYFISALRGDLFSTADHLVYWNEFTNSSLPIYFHIFSIAICAAVVYRGVKKGIETANKILVPALLGILILLFFRAITLPGAFEGIKYFFTPDLNVILDYKVWLNALTQNAWDTGAGWGLIMTYAIYMRKKEDIAINAALISFGNNSVSLLAGITIFSTVFALGSTEAMIEISKSGPANTGLTFIYLPKLFSKLTDYHLLNIFFATIFFIALFFAALTSLISMVELSTRTVIDFGVKREKAVLIIAALAIFFGIPPALNVDILINQDWVWGVGLILSGFFIAFAVLRFGVDNFRTSVINSFGSDIQIGKWFNFVLKFLIPLQAIVLLLWWLISSLNWDPDWLNPFHLENAGTCLFQWGIALLIFIILNKKMVNKIFAEKTE